MEYTNGSYTASGNDFEMKYPLNRQRDHGSTYIDRDLPSALQRWESSEELDLSLHQAARDGDPQVMRKILESIQVKKRRKVNELDENNLAPLHYAARYNHLEVVKLLVDNGAVPAKKGEDDATPMHFAARFKRSRVHHASESERNRNHDGKLTNQVDREGSVIFYLESVGADVNSQDIYGLTPLHFAAMRGNDVAALELLHCNNIRIEAVDKQIMTPLHVACTHGSTEIVAMLIKQGALIRCKDEQDNTPLHLACLEGHTQIVKLLFSAGEEQNVLGEMLTDRENNNYGNPLHLAVDSGENEIIELCLNHSKRPFGVSILYMGWDKHYGFQLYQSDPSGNYGGWKATCIGNNSAAAVSMLKQEYKEGETKLTDALALAVKVLSKTLDMTKVTPEKLEIATLTRENNKTKITILQANEVQKYITEFEAETAKAEAEKKKKEEKK